MSKKFFSIALVACLGLSMSIPSYAAASNVTISITKEGTSIQEIQDNLQENPLIPKLNMKLFDVMASYYEHIEKYNLANTESDKKAVLDELTEIVDAIHEVIPNLTLNEYENILNGKNPEGATLTDLLDFFGEESTQLFYTKGNSRFVNGELDEPELKLDANKVYEYNTKLLYIKTIYTNASKEEKEDIQDTLTLFKSTLNGYENSETVLATLNSILSGAETETPKEEQALISSFNDVPSSHWAYKNIMAMTQKGLFSGTTTPVNGVGTFAPGKTMTRAEFLTVVIRAMYADELNAMPKVDAGEAWYLNSYELALDKGILQENELDQGDLAKSMSRQEMALVLVRAAEKLGDTPSQLVSTSKIADYSTIGTYYKDYVVKAYSMGMLAGTDSKGTYAPTATMNRAQGATVLNRLTDSSSRAEADFSTPTTSPVVVGQVQTWTEGQNHSEPKVGDTVIKADGTKVVLKSGLGGVLGAGQGVDIYTGTVVNGVTAKEGMTSWFDGTGFFKDKTTGEMHTATQWNTISGVTHPGVKGSSNGEVRNTWWEYDTTDEIWYWIGPVYH